jgi:hypothetical protein
MPNHVTNRIEFYGEQRNIDKVLDLIKGEEECIDFNTIVPMPSNVFQGNLGPKERAMYGANNWYDWSIANWGTKWNAYSSMLDKESNTMEFDSAWSCPLLVLDALAKLCYEHGVSFTGKWADEDTGVNTGVFESDCDGEEYWFSYERVENESSEAYEIYIALKGESNCIGRDKNGNWVHYDCDSCPNANIC